MTERTERQSLENMLRIEQDTLNWQRETDQQYEDVMATMRRMVDLNKKIEATMINRPSSYQTNSR